MGAYKFCVAAVLLLGIISVPIAHAQSIHVDITAKPLSPGDSLTI